MVSASHTKRRNRYGDGAAFTHQLATQSAGHLLSGWLVGLFGSSSFSLPLFLLRNVIQLACYSFSPGQLFVTFAAALGAQFKRVNSRRGGGRNSPGNASDVCGSRWLARVSGSEERASHLMCSVELSVYSSACLYGLACVPRSACPLAAN